MSLSDEQNKTIQYYNLNADQFTQGTLHLDMSFLYEPFLKEIPPAAHILDAGCGPGRDALYFLQHGYQVTAFDASEAMVRSAAKITGLDVKKQRFEELDYFEEFDAIWASASLLHVPASAMDGVLEKLIRALKPARIIFMSFKYGKREEIRNGRLFSDYSEESFLSLIGRHSSLIIRSISITNDSRPGLEAEKWLNALLKKS